MMDMHYHYEFDNTQEDDAILTYHMLLFLCKLGVALKEVRHTQAWSGDITLSLRYKDRVFRSR